MLKILETSGLSHLSIPNLNAQQLNRQDKFHQKAKQCLQIIQEPIITTYPVIIETSYLLAERCNQSIQFKFLEQFIQGRVNIFPLEIYHLERCLDLMRQYADLPMDLADASLVV